MSRGKEAIVRIAKEHLGALNWVSEVLGVPRYDDAPKDFHDAVSEIAARTEQRNCEDANAVALATMGMGL